MPIWSPARHIPAQKIPKCPPPPPALLLPPTQKMLPTLGARSFAAAAAPALWNKVSKVPADIRNVASLNGFKK